MPPSTEHLKATRHSRREIGSMLGSARLLQRASASVGLCNSRRWIVTSTSSIPVDAPAKRWHSSSGDDDNDKKPSPPPPPPTKKRTRPYYNSKKCENLQRLIGKPLQEPAGEMIETRFSDTVFVGVSSLFLRHTVQATCMAVALLMTKAIQKY